MTAHFNQQPFYINHQFLNGLPQKIRNQALEGDVCVHEKKLAIFEMYYKYGTMER